jgi:hypothetical protein
MQQRFTFLLISIFCFIFQLQAQLPEIRFMCGYDQEAILSTTKGTRPAPRAYLDTLYIRRHLDAFSDGAAYLVPKDVLDRFGRDRLGRNDGQFVMAKPEMDALLKKAGSDMTVIETELGIPAGAWKGRPIVRIDIANPRELRLRMPSGNEGGANELWLPGGFLPNGYREAVCDPIVIGRYTETLLELK